MRGVPTIDRRFRGMVTGIRREAMKKKKGEFRKDEVEQVISNNLVETLSKLRLTGLESAMSPRKQVHPYSL